MLVATGWFQHRDVREHEPRTHSTESGSTCAMELPQPRTRNRLACRHCAYGSALCSSSCGCCRSGRWLPRSRISSGGSVTSISCGCHDNHRRVQTIIGLLGLWIAGTEVKSIIKGPTMRHALRPSGQSFFTERSGLAHHHERVADGVIRGDSASGSCKIKKEQCVPHSPGGNRWRRRALFASRIRRSAGEV